MVKLPEGVNIHNLIDDLRIFSWEAADVLIHYSKIVENTDYKKNNILINKDVNSPVTVADLEVNDLVLKRMNEKYHGIQWRYLSEENSKMAPNYYDFDSNWEWILDPLDGTKDFIQGTGNYAMHFALNYKRKPILGVVLIPEKDELWIANGEKIWCEGRVKTKPKLSQFKNKTLKEMTLVSSKNHSNPILRNLIHEANFRETLIMGSIGCKIASIIRGESDIYICLSLHGKSSPKDWDFAAPEIILKTAGGAITNLENEDLVYGRKDYKQDGIIVATNNQKNHKDICFQLKEIIEENNLYDLKNS